MKCLSCKSPGPRVAETRDSPAEIRRRRICFCGAEWWTSEKPERASLVVKESLISGLPVVHRQSTGSPPLGEVYLDLGSGSGSDSSGPSKLTNGLDNTKGQNLFFRVLTGFCEIWQRRYSAKYFPSAGDKNQLGRLLQGLDAASIGELRKAFENYLADNSRWASEECRHSLMAFCTGNGFNKYRVAAVKNGAPPPPPTTKPPLPSFKGLDVEPMPEWMK